MLDPLTVIADFCGAHPLAWRGGLLLGMAGAGTAGSVTHCLPMCGPFVLGQVADRMARLPAARMREGCRLRAGLLLPYHLGRLTTYAALGAMVGGLGRLVSGLPWLGELRSGLLLAAAALFLGHAAGALGPSLGGFRRLGRMLSRATRALDRHSVAGTYGLGLALGLLPCGFLYAALITAAASGGAAPGAISLLAFGVGTMPMLALLGVAGRQIGLRANRHLRAIAPVALVGNGILLIGLALTG